MKNENFIVIQGFMINELNLKRNELILYAIIYGFSQDDESEYYGSQRYIAKAMSVSLPTANKLINKLLDKKLIKRTSESHYRVLKKVKQGVKESLTLGVKESLTLGVKESLTNKYNTNYNNNNNIAKFENFAIPNLLADKQKHIQIIGLYGKAKQIKWSNKQQQQSFIKRNLRSARDLVGYDYKKIANTMKHLLDEADFKWTLETVGKYIDEDLTKLKKLTKSEDDIIKDIINN